MNKVIIINLNGIAYQLEENGYEALRRYLDAAAGRLEGNPDRDEIIADIEQSIADKFRAALGANKTVVVTKEVLDVIEEMGPVQDASDDAAGGAAGGAAARKAGPEPAAAGESPPPPKRLYRIREGAQLFGVCNGLAAYFNIDVTLIRILFACMVLTGGAGFLLYLAMVLVVPWANTAAERAAATGSPSTAEEFIRRAKEGYYEGMKTFGDRRAFREWKWKFRQEMRQRRRDFKNEMRQNAEQWRHSWQQHWSQWPHPHPGWWFAFPILGVLSAVLTLLCLASIASLVLTGAVFGFFMPAGIHLWLGILILLVVFSLLKLPLKAMRYSCYYHGGYGPGYYRPVYHMWNSLVWLAFLIVLLWALNSHSEHAHAAIEHVRAAAHHVVDALRDWWNTPSPKP
jgi:phage shock protein PspC (stress-responsive transcriptional regulator)